MLAVARQKLSAVSSNAAKFCREYHVLSVGLVLCLAAIFLVNYNPLPRTLYWPVLLIFVFVGPSFTRRVLSTSVIFWAAAIYLAALGVSSLAQADVSGAAAWRHFRLSFLVLSFLLVIAFLVSSSRRWLANFFFTMGLVVALSAAINMSIFILWELYLGQFGDRLIALLGMPAYWNSTNISATYAIYFVGAVAATITGEFSRMQRRMLTIAALILLAAVFMTQARSAILAILAAFVVFVGVTSRGTRLTMLAALIVTCVGIAGIPQLRELLWARGLSYRLELWTDYLAMATDRPFLGFSPLKNIDIFMQDGFRVDQPHNLVLSAQIRGGIAAAGAMLAILLGGIYWSAKYWRKTQCAIPLCVIVTMSVVGMFDYQLLSTYPDWAWVTFWVPIGVCIGAEVRMRGELQPSPLEAAL